MTRNRSVRVASGDNEPEALPDREWIAYLEGDQDHFLIRHIGEANHLTDLGYQLATTMPEEIVGTITGKIENFLGAFDKGLDEYIEHYESERNYRRGSR